MVLCLNKRVRIQLYIQKTPISINLWVRLMSISLFSLFFEEHVNPIILGPLSSVSAKN